MDSAIEKAEVLYTKPKPFSLSPPNALPHHFFVLVVYGPSITRNGTIKYSYRGKCRCCQCDTRKSGNADHKANEYVEIEDNRTPKRTRARAEANACELRSDSQQTSLLCSCFCEQSAVMRFVWVI